MAAVNNSIIPRDPVTMLSTYASIDLNDINSTFSTYAVIIPQISTNTNTALRLAQAAGPAISTFSTSVGGAINTLSNATAIQILSLGNSISSVSSFTGVAQGGVNSLGISLSTVSTTAGLALNMTGSISSISTLTGNNTIAIAGLGATISSQSTVIGHVEAGLSTVSTSSGLNIGPTGPTGPTGPASDSATWANYVAVADIRCGYSTLRDVAQLNQGSTNLLAAELGAVFGIHNSTFGTGSFVAGLSNVEFGSTNCVMGSRNFVSTNNAVAFGISNIVTGVGSHAEGLSNIVGDNFNYAMGTSNRILAGSNNFIGGQNNIISTGSLNLIFGFDNSNGGGGGNFIVGTDNRTTTANCNIVYGDSNNVTRTAFGLVGGRRNNTNLSSEGSNIFGPVVFGLCNAALHSYTYTEGVYNSTIGYGAHTQGMHNVNYGRYSHVTGLTAVNRIPVAQTYANNFFLNGLGIPVTGSAQTNILTMTSGTATANNYKFFRYWDPNAFQLGEWNTNFSTLSTVVMSNQDYPLSHTYNLALTGYNSNYGPTSTAGKGYYYAEYRASMYFDTRTNALYVGNLVAGTFTAATSSPITLTAANAANNLAGTVTPTITVRARANVVNAGSNAAQIAFEIASSDARVTNYYAHVRIDEVLMPLIDPIF
jgi:hypothetical protein